MKRCVIIGGGEMTGFADIKKIISDEDYVICCDAGYLYSQKLDIKPHLLVGDFDSIPKPDTDIETVVLPCEKDDTDSFFAAKAGLRRGFTDFLLLGMTGGRLDHTFAAISILEYLDLQGAHGEIIDDYTRIRVTRETVNIDPTCRYFSVFSQGRAEGVTITGSRYNLQNAVIDSDYQYGVSNEPRGTARVSVKHGKLIIMEIFDVSR